ncbi:NADPH oxidase 5-like [Oratosquilla oratoria]|uniref:NADPH oxidase 5-like n=1 Tax=Oratosquilla oratoria TaxID=337810 RepID=UPI003F75B402
MMRQESKMQFLDVPLEGGSNQKIAVVKQNTRRRFSWIKNNAPYMIFTILFFGLNFSLFLSRAYQYRHSNLLEMGARACGQCLNLNCALLLSLILRRSMTRLRNSRLGQYFPCDSHVHFHKTAGWAVFFFSIFHTIFHLANFVNLSEHTGIGLQSYLWDTRLGIGWVNGWANPTGVVLLVILAVIVAFSHRIVRKSGYFEIFYWTHLLSLPFWVLLILHGRNFWKWLLLPGTGFLLEVILRVSQVCSKRGRTIVMSGATLPSNVVKLTIRRPSDFEFKAGEYVFLNIPRVARYEWHPFTISSAPEQEDYFTVHIRAVGEWTKRAYQLFYVDEIQRQLHREDKPSKDIHTQLTTKEESDIIITLDPPPKDESDNSKGNRYNANLREFNRKVSVFSRPAILEVEPECKDVPRVCLTPTFKPHHNPDTLVRKKSISLTSLSVKNLNFDNNELTFDHFGQFTNHAFDGSTTSINTSNVGSTLGIQHVGNTLTTTLEVNRQTPSRKCSVASIQMKPPTESLKKIEVYVDGPYGAPSTRIFNVSHAVLIGAGIGVTPFASILQSVMYRYRAAKAKCPYCNVPSCIALPATLKKLRKVNFIWVNRDMGSFDWFLELLEALENEQKVPGAAMERFLTLQLYKTGSSPLRPNLPLASSIRSGRPDWDKLFQAIREEKAGKISVFYCGPPALAAVLRKKCIQYEFGFIREMF